MDHIGGRTYKDDLLLLAPARKVGILGQKTVPGMDGIDLVLPGSMDDPFDIQEFRGIAQALGEIDDMIRFVQVPGIGLFAGLDHPGTDFHLPGRADDPARNLSPVGDKYARNVHHDRLERNITVFAAWVVDKFILQCLEGSDEFVPGNRRIDHLIDEPFLVGNIGIGDLAAVFLGQLFAHGRRIFRFSQLLPVEDGYGAFRTHDGYLGGRPGKIEVSSQVFAVHHTVCSTVRFAEDDGNLGHRGIGVGIKQFGPVPDDPVVLLVEPGEESGYIREGRQRDVE